MRRRTCSDIEGAEGFWEGCDGLEAPDVSSEAVLWASRFREAVALLRFRRERCDC